MASWLLTSCEIVGWNACGISQGLFHKVVAQLDAGGSGSVFCLQEVMSWAPGPLLDAPWLGVFTSEACRSAVVLPSRVQGSVRHEKFGCYTASVLVGKTAVCSLYLPDISKSETEYEEVVQEARSILECMREKGATSFILSSDTQAQLPPGNDADGTSDILGPQACGDCNCCAREAYRRALYLSLVRDFGMVVASTWSQSTNNYTRQHQSGQAFVGRLITLPSAED